MAGSRLGIHVTTAGVSKPSQLPTTANNQSSSGFVRHPSPQHRKNLTNHLQIIKTPIRKMVNDPRMSAQEVCRHIFIINETVPFLELTELPVS